MMTQTLMLAKILQVCIFFFSISIFNDFGKFLHKLLSRRYAKIVAMLHANILFLAQIFDAHKQCKISSHCN